MTAAIPDLYDFLRGPGFVISIVVFICGTLYRTLRLIRATRRIQKNSIGGEIIADAKPLHIQGSLLKRIITSAKLKLRNSIFSTNPLMGIISLVFHILLFLTPVFLFAHNTVADLTIGISLPAFPEDMSDLFTVMLILFGVLFLLRRILIPRVRALSTARDYFILLLVLTPFVSGFLAYHHIFNYRSVIFTHMITGEIAIMIVPFTSLVHMPFIIFSRFFIDSEYSIKPGTRRW